jgi:site-specific DNA recombinase
MAARNVPSAPGPLRPHSSPSSAAGTWVWSDTVAHEPLVNVEDFEAAKFIRADGGRGRQSQREARLRVIHPYVLRGLIYCGICGRKMQAQHNNQRIRPHRLERTIRELAATHRPAPAAPAPADDSTATVAEYDAKLARYQAALDAGGDPATIAGWTRTVTAQRAAALARATARPAAHGTPLTEDAIQQIIQALGDIRDVIRSADAASKARIYNQLELRLTYQPGQNRVHAQANLNPSGRGGMGSVRGGT